MIPYRYALRRRVMGGAGIVSPLVLYDAGDQKADITGGWAATLTGRGGYWGYSATSIELTATSSGNPAVYVTCNPIEISGYSKLKMRCSCGSPASYSILLALGLYDSATAYYNSAYPEGRLLKGTSGYTQEITVDISGASGLKYIGGYFTGGSSSTTANISKIWLEV